MNLRHDMPHLFGGAFLASALPHFVNGIVGGIFSEPVRHICMQGALSLDGESVAGSHEPHRCPPTPRLRG